MVSINTGRYVYEFVIILGFLVITSIFFISFIIHSQYSENLASYFTVNCHCLGIIYVFNYLIIMVFHEGLIFLEGSCQIYNQMLFNETFYHDQVQQMNKLNPSINIFSTCQQCAFSNGNFLEATNISLEIQSFSNTIKSF